MDTFEVCCIEWREVATLLTVHACPDEWIFSVKVLAVYKLVLFYHCCFSVVFQLSLQTLQEVNLVLYLYLAHIKTLLQLYTRVCSISTGLDVRRHTVQSVKDKALDYLSCPFGSPS